MAKKAGFKDFIFREHRILTYWAIIIVAFNFTLMKILYPHAITIGDGNFYVRTAINSSEISVWPIGYSKLLEWIHLFSRSEWVIVVLQYILMEGAVLYFYFTIKYLLYPGKGVSLFIYFFLLLNPFILCFTNYVLTDSLFATLTIIWFTMTLWFLHKPDPVRAILLVILIFLLYSIRQYATFYPLITVPILFLSRIRWWVKLSVIILGCTLFLIFIRHTEDLYEKFIGRREFSPFSGWQLAGNALLMYRHIPHREADIPPPALKDLHQLVLLELNAMPPPDVMPDDNLQIYFTWFKRSPLMKYSHADFDDDVSSEELKKWASVGSLYHDYGIFLIKRHPYAFFRYYVVQGLVWFVDEKVEITNIYPEGGVKITDRIKNWFGYDSNWLPCTRSHLLSIIYFPWILNIFNLFFLLGVIGYFYLGCYKTAGSIVNKAVILVTVYWLVNFLFIVLSAPAMLRYSLSIMILDIGFVPLLLERIYLVMRKPMKAISTPA